MSCLPLACLSTSFRCRILGFHPIICDVVSGNASFSSLVTLFVALPFSSLSSVGSLSMVSLVSIQAPLVQPLVFVVVTTNCKSITKYEQLVPPTLPT